jgi:hypothetical protein
MILETNPNFSYHVLLVVDYHREYPLVEPAEILWDHDHLEDAMRAFNVTDVDLNMVRAMIFKDLPRRYNGAYDTGDIVTMYRIQGDVATIQRVYEDLAQQLMGGPRGADDDTFDYWPNAFDMLYVLAQDLINLDIQKFLRQYIFQTFVRVVDSAIALNGPPSEWEAEFLDDNLNRLKTILNERNEV